MQKQINNPKLQGQNSSTPALTGSQEVLEDEIVVDVTPEPITSSGGFVNYGDNRAKRRREIELLKQCLDNGIITPEEYKNKCQLIEIKYSL
jgi:hypothetical protein